MEKLPKKEYWDEFLRRADIPEEFVDVYARSFVEHRISEKILPKLNRKYLKDMGITVVGDIKSILEYINHVTEDQSPQAASVDFSKKEIEELITAFKDSDFKNAVKMMNSADFTNTLMQWNEFKNYQEELITALNDSDFKKAMKTMNSVDFKNTLKQLNELLED